MYVFLLERISLLKIFKQKPVFSMCDQVSAGNEIDMVQVLST